MTEFRISKRTALRDVSELEALGYLYMLKVEKMGVPCLTSSVTNPNLL